MLLLGGDEGGLTATAGEPEDAWLLWSLAESITEVSIVTHATTTSTAHGRSPSVVTGGEMS